MKQFGMEGGKKDQALKFGQTTLFIEGITVEVEKMESVFINGLMELFTKENGSTMRFLVMYKIYLNANIRAFFISRMIEFTWASF